MKLALTETPKTGFLATRPTCHQSMWLLSGRISFGCILKIKKIGDYDNEIRSVYQFLDGNLTRGRFERFAYVAKELT